MNDIQKLRELTKQRIATIDFEYTSYSITLPRFKKSFSSLNAEELVKTQPMSLPAGLVFEMEFKK